MAICRFTHLDLDLEVRAGLIETGFATKDSSCSIFRDLHDLHSLAPLPKRLRTFAPRCLRGHGDAGGACSRGADAEVPAGRVARGAPRGRGVPPLRELLAESCLARTLLAQVSVTNLNSVRNASRTRCLKNALADSQVFEAGGP